MFDLKWGGKVVDTPGMREFALWKIPPEELASMFPEMRPFLGLCLFRADCTHSHEPGCAIKRAVSAGGITERRYQSYLRLGR
jgi:ribosome biogenesis GTPase